MGQNWKENRAYKHRRKRCVRCGEIDAFTLAGRQSCAVCCEKQAEYYEQNRERIKAQRKERAAWYKANGICPRCGKPNDSNFESCAECRDKKKFYQRIRRQKMNVPSEVNWPRGDNGICYICNKRPKVEGKRVCEICCGKLMASLEKANALHDNSGHIWRKLPVYDRWIRRAE